MKHLTTQNFINSAMIEDVLKQHGIPHFKKSIRGAGLSVYYGQMSDTYEFFVEEMFLEKARELVVELVGEETIEEDELSKAIKEVKEGDSEMKVFKYSAFNCILSFLTGIIFFVMTIGGIFIFGSMEIHSVLVFIILFVPIFSFVMGAFFLIGLVLPKGTVYINRKRCICDSLSGSNILDFNDVEVKFGKLVISFWHDKKVIRIYNSKANRQFVNNLMESSE